MHIFGHFRTITKHRHTVIALCFKAGIGFQGLFHDLSKYSFTEFIPGAKYWTGKHSPIRDEREEKGYSLAWMHHKGRNRHHYEYWMDSDPATKILVPVPMPDNYLIEMFCDRVAASKVYNGKAYNDTMPLEYLEKEKKSWQIHPDTEYKLVALLNMLAEKGEKETFRYIRAERKLQRKSKKA